MAGYFWRIWAVVLVLAILWLGWCMKTSQPAEAQSGVAEVVRAKAFEVVDASGKVRAKLSTLADGSPGLRLLDASGEARALLATLPDGSPGLRLFDASGKLRAVLDTDPDGTPGLSLLDASGRVLFSAP